MKVQLVLVRLGVVKNLHVAALHAHSQPFSSGTVAQREDLQRGQNNTIGSDMISNMCFKSSKLILFYNQWSPKRLLPTCEVKSCCWSCLPSLKSQERTVLSSPPVHSLVPSWEMSMQLAPSVWPWNCLENHKTPNMSVTEEKAFPTLTITILFLKYKELCF